MTLVERLRDWASPHYVMQLPEIPLAQKDMREAAARIEALEAENFALAAGQCPNVVGDEGGTPRCKEIDALRAEVAALRKDAERWRAFLATRPESTHEVICAAIDSAIQQHAANCSRHQPDSASTNQTPGALG